MHGLKMRAVLCLVAQLCLTLMDCSLPGFSVHGISQARIPEWVAISPGDLPDSEIEAVSPAPAGRFFITVPPGKPRASNYLHFIFS